MVVLVQYEVGGNNFLVQYEYTHKTDMSPCFLPYECYEEEVPKRGKQDYIRPSKIKLDELFNIDQDPVDVGCCMFEESLYLYVIYCFFIF